nr:MAG TPA: hypothetical protein [Caudoviricetes sp.]
MALKFRLSDMRGIFFPCYRLVCHLFTPLRIVLVPLARLL